MTPDKIADITALAEAATRAGWTVDSFGNICIGMKPLFKRTGASTKDAAFIAAARTAVPELLAERKGLVARVAVLSASVLAVVNAARAYLPPDGIDAQECLNRILGATDNPAINPIIAEIERG